MKLDELMRLVYRQLERHGPRCAAHRIEVHWTDRDALLARLERSHQFGTALAHDVATVYGVIVEERRTANPGWATIRGHRGEHLGYAEIRTGKLTGGYSYGLPPEMLML